MFGGKRVWAVSFLFHVAAAWNQVAVAQDNTIRIDIGYTYVGAYARANISSTVILSGHGRVDEAMRGSNSIGQTEARQIAQELGGERWRVIGPSRLQRTINYENHHQILQVTVSGRACNTTVTTRLKPGKTKYILRPLGGGRPYVDQKPRYENLTCTIR